MHISKSHKGRQVDSIPGLVDGSTTITAASGTGALALDTAAPTAAGVTAPPLAQGTSIVITSTPASTPEPSPSGESVGDTTSASRKSEIPLGAVIGACIGAFVGVVVLICIFYAWYKRSSDKMSTAARRNAAGKEEQRRARAQSFNRLGDSEKAHDASDVPPPVLSAHEQQESDEKNFSMFKKSPSVRTAYTHKTTTDEENAFDLPQLQFTKYHPTLAQELALEAPEKPFAGAAVRQNSAVSSWDGDTLGDDTFLSMRSVRVESGTMSPTMVMAKMTPPATASPMHKWESAEVINMDDEVSHPPVSRNPFADMSDPEERPSRSTNPFFNAQDANRTSRVMRSRSNSRTSRTSRAHSLVRPDSHVTPSLNPFLDYHEAADGLPPHTGIPTESKSHSSSSSNSVGSERALASLIAALDLTKEEVEERLRVVSMQGSMVSAYSENDDSDIATVREFPLPPATAPRP